MLLKSYHEPTVGVVKARAVPPPPSAPKSNAPTAPLPLDPVDNMTNSQPANLSGSSSANNTSELAFGTEDLKQDNPVKTSAHIPADYSSETKAFLLDVDEAIATRKQRLDTPTGNYYLK
jgi:hypothetical protein